jgi:hypothetical protein
LDILAVLHLFTVLNLLAILNLLAVHATTRYRVLGQNAVAANKIMIG